MSTKKAKIKDWFGIWFDSPFYHILYKHRDYEEARFFIDKLIGLLEIKKSGKIMDLACGKGRHSIYLSKKGFNVTGLDLSIQNIEYAKRFESENLIFFVHDMRHTWCKDEFDYVFNLFTSFGYFDTIEENQDAINAVAESLKKGGTFVLDFLNPYTVAHQLIPEEVKHIEGIEFHINKVVSDDGYIIKDIRFEHKNKPYHFQERVKAIRRVEFLQYFEHAGLQLCNLFGDYHLNEYVADKSERMIFVLKK